MKYTWVMFLVLTVAGGLIAFMGDRLGRYMGKRRMSVFGLRPRHTALCFTVVAGMIIALTSLGVMSSLSAHVRIALFEVDSLQARQAELTRRQRELVRENQSLSRERSRLQADYASTRARVEALSREEQRSRAQLAQTRARLSQMRVQAERRIARLRQEAEARARVAAVKSRQIAVLERRLGRMQAELARVSDHLATAREQQKLAEARRKEAVARYQEISTRFELASAQHVATQEELAKAQDHLGKLLDDIRARQQQVKDAERQIERLQSVQTELVAQRDDLARQIEDLKAQQADLKEAVLLARRNESDALSWVRSQRMNRLLFARGQELAWEVVDGREPRARIREHLLGVVERARQAAASRGAGSTNDPASALVAVRFVEQGDAVPSMLTGVQAIDAATEEISRANTSVVVQLKAATNTVAGDPVVAEIQVWMNRLVFREGQPVAQKVIRGGQPVGRIVEELVALLHRDVRTAAVERGMIPRSASADGIATTVQVGEVPLSDVIATAERIRRHRNGATVEVVAATDLWAADSMKVAFRVAPLPARDGERRSGGILTVR